MSSAQKSVIDPRKKTSAASIKTPQSLIHIKHRISLLQYKYWILLLRELREQFDAGTPPDENGFRFVSMDKLEAAIGYVPNKAEFFKDLLALKNETIAFNVLEKDGQEAKYGAGFISEWKITSQRVAFKFPSVLENVMRGLEHPKAIFQQLNWEIFNHFSGKYEAVIYKLCKDYVGVNQTPYMTVAEFRDYMGLKPTEYPVFMKLNEWVIKKPTDRINESDISDITVTPDYERQGRKVLGLRFLIQRKNQTTITFPELEPSPAFRFAKVHVDSNLQSQYLALRAPEEIELCIDRANEYAETQEKAGNEVNLGAVYRKAITEGWHTQHAEKKARKKSVAVEMQKKAEEKQQEKTAKEEALREATAKNIAELDKFDAMPEDIKRRIREEYLKSVELPALRRAFEKEGERHPMHRSVFVQFLYKNVNT
jgi:Initiator Replication protein